ncbi:hypothetical protein ACIOVF_01325 [Pseudomonas sp. NPDC087612]|uniref:hypothetical protein n=1 Tax=Pseudomonas sp. NPDC087612 TaxID=3364441 RepID=UPI003822D713
MSKRILWKQGDFIVIGLKNGDYTIAQMLTSPVLRFFDIVSQEDDWATVEWRNVKPTFQIFVANTVLKELGVRKIKIDLPPSSNLDPFWIKPYTSMDVQHYKGKPSDFPFLGGKLIDLGPNNDRETTTAPVLKHDLTLPEDREKIERYELTNMWGDQDLEDRLVRFFRTGVNRDDLKYEIFPTLWADRAQLRPLTRRLPIPLR